MNPTDQKKIEDGVTEGLKQIQLINTWEQVRHIPSFMKIFNKIKAEKEGLKPLHDKYEDVLAALTPDQIDAIVRKSLNKKKDG